MPLRHPADPGVFAAFDPSWTATGCVLLRYLPERSSVELLDFDLIERPSGFNSSNRPVHAKDFGWVMGLMGELARFSAKANLIIKEADGGSQSARAAKCKAFAHAAVAAVIKGRKLPYLQLTENVVRKALLTPGELRGKNATEQKLLVREYAESILGPLRREPEKSKAARDRNLNISDAAAVGLAAIKTNEFQLWSGSW